MKINASIHIEADDKVSVGLVPGAVCVTMHRPESWMGSADLYVYRYRSPELYAKLCKAFGLQNETAPGDQTESGVPGGNEPAQEMVPQKVQV